MSKTNRQWHEQNRMPAKASTEQRLPWHLQHSQHCSCRPIPASLVALMEARGLQLPVVPNSVSGQRS